MTADNANVRVMNALRRLVSALRTTGADALGARPMSVAQQFALRVIGRHPGLTMSALAGATLTTRSAVSEVVVRLVNAGMVRREVDASDQRRVRLHLTPEGAVTYGLLGETLPERLVAALDGLEPETLELLATALEQWTETAGLGSVAPDMFGEPSGPSSRDARGSTRRAPDHSAHHALPEDEAPNSPSSRTASGTSRASER